MVFDKLCNSILERVFHGTMHDVVGNFSLNKIGTGEGNIAYGWGLYFAENPEIAKGYKKGLTHKDFLRKVSEVYDEYTSPEEADEALESAGLTSNQMALVKALQKEDWWGFDYPHQAVNAALKEPQNFEHGEEVDEALENFGNLYAVDINADRDNDFLDWNSPISMESERAKKVFDEINYLDLYAPNGMVFRDYISATGEEPKSSEIYKSLSEKLSPQEASELFLKHGIKGIRYLDQRSREKGDGTYNFVIFDPRIIQIVSKNGEFVMSSKTPENIEV